MGGIKLQLLGHLCVCVMCCVRCAARQALPRWLVDMHLPLPPAPSGHLCVSCIRCPDLGNARSPASSMCCVVRVSARPLCPLATPCNDQISPQPQQAGLRCRPLPQPPREREPAPSPASNLPYTAPPSLPPSLPRGLAFQTPTSLFPSVRHYHCVLCALCSVLVLRLLRSVLSCARAR
eukprot:COSAG01_NODE_1889_length_8979_cov_6.682770_7_plen_178_part_00